MPKYENDEIFAMVELGIIQKPEARALLEVDKALDPAVEAGKERFSKAVLDPDYEEEALKQAMAEAEHAGGKPFDPNTHPRGKAL